MDIDRVPLSCIARGQASFSSARGIALHLCARIAAWLLQLIATQARSSAIAAHVLPPVVEEEKPASKKRRGFSRRPGIRRRPALRWRSSVLQQGEGNPPAPATTHQTGANAEAEGAHDEARLPPERQQIGERRRRLPVHATCSPDAAATALTIPESLNHTRTGSTGVGCR